MGQACSRGSGGFFGGRKRKEIAFLLQGFYESGKTSILRQMKFGEMGPTFHTSSTEVEALSYEGETIHGWDFGVREKHRIWYRLPHEYVDGLIYVIDSADMSRLDDAIDELQDYVLQSEHLAKKVVMVLANKQDLENALPAIQIEDMVKKNCRIGLGMTVFVMPCSAATREGMWEAFAFFMKMVKNKKNKDVKVPSGLIPRAWETANQEPASKEFDDITKEIPATTGMLHKIKNSKLKDPVSFFKSILFH